MQDSSNRISIVVVTAGVNDYLTPCLDSIKGQTYSPLEIIVIDNSLNENLAQRIVKAHPEIKLYCSPANLFYSGSLNKGIELSEGGFILCLNDDVILDKKFIEEALRGFFLDSKIGMVAGKVLRYDKKTIDTTGLFLSLYHSAQDRGYGIKDKGQFEKAGLIFGVNGAVAFYRREMLDEIKINPSTRFVLRQAQDSPRAQSRGFARSEYFDSDYRFFYEDLDIAWRARLFGWKAYYIPQAIAYHARGGSVRGGIGLNKPCARRYLSAELHADLIKNRYLTIIKNESFFSFLFGLPFLALYDFVAWLYVLFFNPEAIKIFISNLKYLAGAFKKRKILIQMKEIRRK